MSSRRLEMRTKDNSASSPSMHWILVRNVAGDESATVGYASVGCLRLLTGDAVETGALS